LQLFIILGCAGNSRKQLKGYLINVGIAFFSTILKHRNKGEASSLLIVTEKRVWFWVGTYVRLSILPHQISQQDWISVYKETVKLLKAYDFADLGEKSYLIFRSLYMLNRKNMKSLLDFGEHVGT